MSRKKWTPSPAPSAANQKQRDKRKWQIALRRYIFLESPCTQYAPYFGLDAQNLRKWIALQFTGDQNWDNFSQQWQFEHRVPLSAFDFEDDIELRLCWHFTNIKVDSLENGKKLTPAPDLLTAQQYYKKLLEATSNIVCSLMLDKIDVLASHQQPSTATMESFLNDNHMYLIQLAALTPYQYDQLNAGVSIDDIIKEMVLLSGK